MGKPAARVGDMHTCPIPTHVGGPVLPPGKVTVWIGGLPAATVGTMCTCVGPPDVIVEGSSSVLIGGMPAARMGDMTAHGGRVVMGCMTVLIGDSGGDGSSNVTLSNRANGPGGSRSPAPGGLVPAGGGTGTSPKDARDADKKARYEARLVLIAKGRQRAKDLRAKPQTDPWHAHRQLQEAAALTSAADRLERNNKAIERARLSNDIYNIWDKKGNPVALPDGSPPDGWEVKEYKFDKKTGFAYAVYESKFEKPAKPVLVYRGTQTRQDWKTNGKQGFGMQDDQYNQSIKTAQTMSKKYPDGFEIAGHSKAGGQTAAASIVTGAKGYGINSAGVHSNTVGRYGHSTEEAKRLGPDGTPLLESYNFPYDPLSNLQDTGVPILKGSLMVIPPTQPLGIWLTLSGAGPSAAGQRYILPAVDEHGNPIRHNPAKLSDHHDPKMLIASMEHQKRSDAQTLSEDMD